jgi:hypothetical protein
LTKYSQGQLETLWLDTAKGTKYASNGWALLMSAIAMAESAGDSNAYNASGATGLWQILGAVSPADQSQLKDPTVNAHEALLKLQSQGLGAWVTYTSGAYKSYLGSVSPSTLPTGTGGGGAPSSSSSSGTAQFDWSLTSIPGLGQLGKIITGTTGTFSTIGDAAKAIAGLVQAVNKLTQLVMLLFRPEFWLRVGAFLFGLLTLGAALYFLKEAF